MVRNPVAGTLVPLYLHLHFSYTRIKSTNLVTMKNILHSGQF